jgi:hypothetical protein
VTNVPRNRWIEWIFMPVTLTIIIVAWFNPTVTWLLHAVAGPDRLAPSPTLALMMIVLLISTFVTRLALTDRERHPRVLIVISGLVTIGMAAAFSYRGTAFLHDLFNWGDAISPEFVLLVAMAALWWRGILIGRSQALVEESLEQTFFTGVVALGLLLYFNQVTPHLPSLDLLATVIVFFAASLGALMIVNIERARLHHTDPGFQFNRHWIGTIVGVIAAILLGAIGLASIFSPDSVRELGEALRPIVRVIGSALLQIFIFITDLLLRLLEPLIPVIKAVLQALVDLLGRLAAVFRDLGLNINVADVQHSIENFLNSPGFLTVTRGSLMIVVLVAFILVVVWALYRSGLLSRRNYDEARENIASRELLLGQIKQLLSRLRPRRAPAHSLYLPLDGTDPRLAVRRVYQEFLEWTRVRVRPRAPQQTPLAYAEKLGNLSPAQQEPVGTLTALYLRARYADDTLTLDEAEAAHAALVRLQATPVIQSPLSED